MELFRSLAVLAEAPGPQHAGIGRLLGLPGAPDAAEYTEVFGFQLYPYASVYLGPEGALGGEAQDRVAGFWRALGQTPPQEPDHLASLLGLYATLGDHEAADDDAARRALWRHSRKALFWEHLGSWIFAYLHKMQEVAPPYFRAWARLLQVALTEAARELGAPDRLPLHLRDVPAMTDPRAGGLTPFLDGLLAMVRCGVLLTRADLARAASDLGLALRIGDRRFLLRTLLGQDAWKALDWLAGEADRWAVCHLQVRRLSEEIAGFWHRRAAATASLLMSLRDDLNGMEAHVRDSVTPAQGAS
ncbi:MAG: molecular chaperone TorD family protein [Armatimonadetes bacterium]|nr:molecular chaperone TorD family protein [Armatimonadota bacterium]